MTRALLGALFVFAASCRPGAGVVHNESDAAPEDARIVPNNGDSSDMPVGDDVSTPDSGVRESDGGTDMAVGGDTGGVVDAGLDMAPPPPMPSTVYVAESDGTIHWGTFDPDSSSLNLAANIERGGNQNFLAFDATGDRLYAVNGNTVEAFSLAADGTPTFLGSADAGIGGTALEVDRDRRFAFVASYGGDSVAVLPLDADGIPSNATMTFGGAADPEFCRRAHQVRVHPSNDWVYVPCLGSNHVAGFALDAAGGVVTPLAPASTAAGAGPRHMDFHPTLPRAYVIGELDDTITIFSIDEATGALAMLASVSTRPQNPDVLGPASDVHVSPDGAFVAGINRNPRNELVIFDVERGGGLTHRTTVSGGGEHARTFTFTPSGSHILVGNSNSQDVVVFSFAGGNPVEVQKISAFDSRVMYVGVR